LFFGVGSIREDYIAMRNDAERASPSAPGAPKVAAAYAHKSHK
jgi:hypothetical protein